MAVARRLLGVAEVVALAPSEPQSWMERLRELNGIDLTRCPRCEESTLRPITIVGRLAKRARPPPDLLERKR